VRASRGLRRKAESADRRCWFGPAMSA
jgi:hypothetical protein